MMNKRVKAILVSLLMALASMSQIVAQGLGNTNEIALDVKSMSFKIRNGYANDKENRWELRKELVYKVIKDYAPDILGLQEVNHEQLGEFKKQFPEYGYIGVASDGGTKGQYSAILYLKSSLKVVDSGDFWISETPEKVSKSWRSAHIRICTWARLQDLKTSKELVIYNTHLDDGSRQAREKGAEMIMKHLHGQKLKDAFIVMGDFNAPEESSAIAQVKGTGAFVNDPYPKAVDAFRVLNPEAKNVGTYNGFSGKDTGAKIDYIFVPKNAQIMESEILKTNQNGRYPSDHFPVIARVRFINSAAKAQIKK
jgi:endonuclease/exonuclease/phosphatase family metal-dependent hydrolase